MSRSGKRRNRQGDPDFPEEDMGNGDSPLQRYKRDGTLLGLAGKDLISYVEDRRKEDESKEAEERRRRDEIEAEERKLKLQLEAEERKRRDEHEFAMQRMQIGADLGLNFNDNAGQSSSNTDSIRGRDKLKMKLPFLDDRDDVETYFRQFERAAKISEWPEDEWAARLGCLLKGKARDAYARLPDDEADDYEAVKTAILARFQLTSEVYRKKFREAKKEKGESSKEYLNRIELLLMRWVSLSEREGKSEDLRQLVLLERFVEGLPADQARFIRERNPKDVSIAAEAARLFEDARQVDHQRNYGSGHQAVQGNKGNFDHHKGVKPKEFDNIKTAVRNTTKPSHMGQGNAPREHKGCFLCGGPHLARNCGKNDKKSDCLLYTSPSPRDAHESRMPSSA